MTTRILLVDGDAEEARAIRAALRHRDDWEVTQARSLLEAIRLAGEAPFDAAVLDAKLPDGSGADILDYLRIGSPGIRIVLLSEDADEGAALHALSHGAGDCLLKDAHLEMELPRRIESLLERVDPEAALVSTLLPVTRYEVAERASDEPPPRAHSADVLGRALAAIVQGRVLAAGVFDMRGKPIAAKLLDGSDEEGLGFAMGTLHGQLGGLWTYGGLKPTGYRMIVDVEGGVLGLTAIPGTYLVAVLFDAETPPRKALDRLDHAALVLHAALEGGAAGPDA